MLRKVVPAVIAILWGLSSPAYAVFVDFEDVASGSVFNIGETFFSSGVLFESVPLTGTNGQPQNSPVQIDSQDFGSRPLGSSGNYIYPRSVVADFSASVGSQDFVAIPFFNSFGTVNLSVNDQPPLVTNAGGAGAFISFDGSVIDGVTVSVEDLGSGRGVIQLSGVIDSVLFGGQETIFDNISTVPEPTTSVLLLMGMTAMLSRARTRTA